MMRVMMIAVAVLAFSLGDANAQFRRGRQTYCTDGNCTVSSGTPITRYVTEPVKAGERVTTTVSSGDDALAEVNAARAQRGLRPYANDPVLNEAARKCAAWRAAHLCHGHCALPEGDFTFLKPVYPIGSCAGGCAAWQPSWGFGACAMYDNYTYCGAAYAMGSDGLKYCHLFVR